MTNSNNRNSALVSRVDRLLATYRKMNNYNDSNNAISNRPGGKFRFMTKHFLKPSHVKALMTGKKRQLLVIEPQMYEGVSVLDKNDEMISAAVNNTPKAKFGGPTLFYEDQGLAVSGGGADHWVLVTPKFADDLQKFLDKKMMKTMSPKVKAAPKPKAAPKEKAAPKANFAPKANLVPKAKKPTQKQLLNNQMRLMNSLQVGLNLMSKASLKKVLVRVKAIERAAQNRLA